MASVASAEQGKQGKKKAGNAPNRDEPSSSELPAILDTARGDEVANAGSAAEAAAVAEGVSAAVLTLRTSMRRLRRLRTSRRRRRETSESGQRGDDIDAIFNQAKQDKNQGAAGSGQKGNKGKADAKTQAKENHLRKKGRSKRREEVPGGAADAESKPRKRTQEGYRVYGRRSWVGIRRLLAHGSVPLRLRTAASDLLKSQISF
ncbi:hypothetical protein CLOM_g1049 [Closterium sp. NIES-68]|nr:hypothetical protein CLOM_g1049 [Closterium sp. NIES-68]